MTTKHPLAKMRATMAALEQFFAALAKALGFNGTAEELEAFIADPAFPKPFHINDVGPELRDPQVYFDKPKHAAVFNALGRTGWKRIMAREVEAFHFRKEIGGVVVELTGAQTNPAVPMFVSEVHVDFFGEARLPAHTVKEVEA